MLVGSALLLSDVKADLTKGSQPTAFPTSQAPPRNTSNQTREQIDARVTEPVVVARDNLFFDFTIGFNALLALFSGLLWRVSRRQSQIAKASQRAYVYVKIEKVEGIDIGERPHFSFVVRNFGNSPAYRMRHQTTWSFAPFPMAETYQLPDLTMHASPEISVPPGAESGGQLIAEMPLTQEQIDRALAANAKLLIWGKVRYQDTFKDSHYTNFCFFHAGRDGAGRDQFLMAPVGNDAD